MWCGLISLDHDWLRAFSGFRMKNTALLQVTILSRSGSDDMAQNHERQLYTISNLGDIMKIKFVMFCQIVCKYNTKIETTKL